MMTTYDDDDHTDIWARFNSLVSASVLLYDEELRAKKGKAKMFSEEDGVFILFPKKPRSPKKKFVIRTNNQNLNGASTSTPYLVTLEEYGTYLRTLIRPWKMLETPPPNPNPQPNKNCKKRALQEKKRSSGDSGFKKAKVVASPGYSWKGKETPEWLNELMERMHGEDLKLIFQRTLFKTDVNPSESRLSMPFNHLIYSDFLTPSEWRVIEDDIDNVNKIGVGAVLVDEEMTMWGVILKRWEMKKESGKGSWNFSLTCGWNEIVTSNRMREGDDVGIWSFRCRDVLCFALTTPPTTL